MFTFGALSLAWGALRSGLSSILALWNALPWPIKAAIIAALFGLYMQHRGLQKGRAECEARIAASIQAAENRDTEIARETKAEADRNRAAAAAREEAINREVRGYVDELAKRTADTCRVGDDAGRYNDGLKMLPYSGLPVVRPGAAAGSGRGAVPGPVPARPGQR